MQKGLCPGCTASFKRAPLREAKSEREEKVVCKCGRIYIYDKEMNTYRRALEKEV